jgi:hypothetical protein
MSELPPIAYVLILVLIGVMLIFTFGTRRNIRRGNALLLWLQEGLPLLGSRTTFRWLGSTAAVLKIERAKEPFREAEVVLVMEPRDVALLWAWARRRGRRDFVILRGRLRHPPRFELEAGDERGWTGRDRLKRLDLEAWSRSEWDGVRVAHSVGADPQAARRLWDGMAAVTGGLWRLSVRRDHPHLEVHLVPPGPEVSSVRLIEAFRETGAAAAG